MTHPYPSADENRFTHTEHAHVVTLMTSFKTGQYMRGEITTSLSLSLSLSLSRLFCFFIFHLISASSLFPFSSVSYLSRELFKNNSHTIILICRTKAHAHIHAHTHTHPQHLYNTAVFHFQRNLHKHRHHLIFINAVIINRRSHKEEEQKARQRYHTKSL